LISESLTLLPIFHREQQHTKTFTVFFVNVLVVHLVGAPYRFAITAGGIAEYLKALVNKNIVYQEVSQPVGEDAQTYSKANIKYTHIPQQEKPYADNRVKYKEGIVALKPRVVVLAMVVFVQAP
jgi:hypothetical protein